MCYAIPAKIIEIGKNSAKADCGGVIKYINHTLVEGIKIGDYVLIHAGFAIGKLDKKSAEESLNLIEKDISQWASKELKKGEFIKWMKKNC